MNEVINDLINKAMLDGFIYSEELEAQIKPDSDEYEIVVKKLKEENVKVITHEQDEVSEIDAEEVNNDLDNLPRADDILTAYIHDIKGFPLLTAEQEIELANEIKAGVEAREKLDSEEILTPDEIEELQDLVDRGEGSKEYFVNCNLRLVVWWSSKYRNRGLAQEDIIQEGNMGLIRAVEKFDPEKGARFSTYASTWIRKHIMRSIQNQARTVRLPIHISSFISKLKKVELELEIKLGRDPRAEEIAAELDITPEKVVEYQNYYADTVSLDTPLGNEEASTLGDLISNPNTTNPFEEIARSEYSNELNRVLKQLNPREYQVITLRFGINDGNARTLEEIGRIIGLTRERVRQIETKALRKLRHPNRSSKMKQFYQV